MKPKTKKESVKWPFRTSKMWAALYLAMVGVVSFVYGNVNPKTGQVQNADVPSTLFFALVMWFFVLVFSETLYLLPDMFAP